MPAGEITFGQQLLGCFGAAGFAEFWALILYYPFDLMKMRM